MSKVNKKIIVAFHGGCSDGFTGAWAAWKKFGARAEYVPLYDRKQIPDQWQEWRGKEMYFIDWTYNPPEITQELSRHNKVIGLDHHLSAEKIFKKLTGSVFNSKHSGAMIAWRYFHPGEKPPKFVEYVEDYDLWRFRFRDTPAFQAFLDIQKMTFPNWTKLARDMESVPGKKKMLETGQILVGEKDRIVKSLASGAESIRLLGHRVLAVNSPVFRNELGHYLCQLKPPFSVVWWQEQNRIRISFRALKSFNILTKLKRLGVAGHPQAGAMVWPLDKPLPWRAKIK